MTDFVSILQVQTEVLQKRQQEKKHMMNAIKKYQKGQCVCCGYRAAWVLGTLELREYSVISCSVVILLSIYGA